MSEKLFGTDGVRGTVGMYPMQPEFCVNLGKVLGEIINRDQLGSAVVIGRDTRQSGAMLQSAFSAGLLSRGINVIDLGVVTTPGVACLTKKVSAAVGAVISASHNPNDQNGIKFFQPSGKKFPEILEREMEVMIAELEGGRELPVGRMGKPVHGHGMTEIYIQDLLDEHPRFELVGIKIVMDCANGASSAFAPQVFGRLGAELVVINGSPTGTNINHNCGSEHVRRHPDYMQKLIAQFDADFGIAFDGDADRVVFVDPQGNLVDGDDMLATLARYFGERLLERSVVATTMSNTGLKLFLEKMAFELHETPVGDKYVLEKLEELRATSNESGKIGLGGEQSGHVIMADDEHFAGDGIRTGLFFIQALKSLGVEISELNSLYEKYPQIICSAYVGNGTRLEKTILQDMQLQLLNTNPGLVRANMRYSGTEPLFRTMLEGNTSLTGHDLALLAHGISQKVQSVAGCPGAELDILDCVHGELKVE